MHPKRRTNGRSDVTRVADRESEVLEAAQPGGEPDRDARLLLRADADAAPERQARRRRCRHGEETARDPDAEGRAERRQARDPGATGARRQPRGSRTPGAREEGRGAAAAPGARRPGQAAPDPAGQPHRRAADARDAHRGVPLAEGSSESAVLGSRGPGEDRGGRHRNRPRHAGHGPGDPAREGGDRGAAGARVGDRRADEHRCARGLHRRRADAARPRARADLDDGPGRPGSARQKAEVGAGDSSKELGAGEEPAQQP